MVCPMTPYEIRRKELERLTREEGPRIWRHQTEENRIKKQQEQREVRTLLENYWPWGRPGGGAPNNIGNVAMKNVNLDELFSNEDMQKARREVGVFNFGRPGGGAPQRNNSGQKQIRFHEDPALRFQWGNDLRRKVDNDLRYRYKREEQEQYRKQLDALVEEKIKAKEQERRKKLEYERKMFLRTPPWGKPGPGGKTWRQPKNIGVNFHKSMGWTNDSIIRNIQEEIRQDKENISSANNIQPNQHNPDCPKYKKQQQIQSKKHEKTPKMASHHNGIELVPLIVKKRPENLKAPLGSTDITRGGAMPKRMHVPEHKYLSDLNQQVHQKHQKLKVARVEDIESCQEHFKTWGSLWGRPGHGAPRSANQKGRLMAMLYPQMQPMPVH